MTVGALWKPLELSLPLAVVKSKFLFSLNHGEAATWALKEDNAILRKPPVRSLHRAAVVSQMGVLTTLIDRVTRFIIDNTINERKYKATGENQWFDQLSPPKIPSHLQPFVAAS